MKLRTFVMPATAGTAGTATAGLSLLGLGISPAFAVDQPVTFQDPQDAAIARSIIALGEETDMVVVAEGIETHAQQSALQALGCSLGQGFLYADRCRPAKYLSSERDDSDTVAVDVVNVIQRYGVGVPHLTDIELVAPPDGSRDARDEIEKCARNGFVVGDAHGARYGVLDVGDHAVAPPAVSTVCAREDGLMGGTPRR